jgi:hypothetical protein
LQIKEESIQHDRHSQGKKKFACPFNGCEKVFTQKSGVNQHIKTFHENQKVN